MNSIAKTSPKTGPYLMLIGIPNVKGGVAEMMSMIRATSASSAVQEPPRN